MLKLIVAALQLFAVFPQNAWCVSLESFSKPIGMEVIAPNIPQRGGPMGFSDAKLSLGLTLPGVVLTPAVAPSFSEPSAPLSVIAPMVPPALPLVERAADRLMQAGAVAERIVGEPGSEASDKARADFVQSVGERPELGDAVIAPSVHEAAAGALAPSSPRAPIRPPNPHGVESYLLGVFAAQVANNALIVSLPLVLMHLQQSIGAIGFITTLTTAIDMSGTLVSGWLTRHFSPETVLKAATWARAATLVAIPALLATGALAAPGAVALYAIDALARGVADTARNTMPMVLVGKDKAALDGLNSKARTAFNLGGIVGPALVGLLALKTFSNAGNWLVAGVFGLAAVAYHLIPHTSPAPMAIVHQADSSKGSALKEALSNRWMRLSLVASSFLALAPGLRALIPSAFAQSILHSPSIAAWLVLAFGLGGTLGDLVYNRLNGKLSAWSWIKLGAGGASALAVGMMCAAFWPLAGAIFIFGVLNETASLALTSSIQSRIPDGAEGGVMSLLRFTGNGTSMLTRFGMGLAFSAVAAPAHAFWLIGAGLAAAAAAQAWISGRLRVLAVASAAALFPGPRLSPIHGFPGRLIVVEGLDGSGKSTQMEMLREHLEAKGLNVVVTTWNSSELVSETVKKAKKAQALTPETFSLFHATDLAERLNKAVIPALKKGSVVLADRYFFTALARDSVRGMDPRWLRQLYSFALKPDLTLYFKLPVETAVGRVLARSDGKLGFSEDFGDDDEAPAPKTDTHGLKYYEAGLDTHLSADPLENFKMFQAQVTAAYDAESKEFGFWTVDATQGREAQHAAIAAQIDRFLGPISSFKKGEPLESAPNIFDKDPAGDADNIRRNYMSEKHGAHFYFRNMLLPMQERFAQLIDHGIIPRVFLHGSPHIDNYAKTAQGAAMVDFDRARVGPYAWDLARLMVSISLRQKREHGFLDPKVLKQLRRGYLHGLRHPERPFSEMRKLKDVEPEEDETSTDAYIKAEKKWVRELRADPLPVDAPEIAALLDGYMKNRNEPDLLKEYAVEEAGRGQGSMGFRGIFLVVLAPRDPKSGKDRILLNIKEVRSDPDTKWYRNPASGDGQRMMMASELYAPGWELRPGYADLNGTQYFVRQIPPLNAKLKKMLDLEEQEDFAYSVGTQLGRAHRLSLQGQSTLEDLEKHFAEHFKDIVEAGAVIRDEIVAAHGRYLKKIR